MSTISTYKYFDSSRYLLHLPKITLPLVFHSFAVFLGLEEYNQVGSCKSLTATVSSTDRQTNRIIGQWELLKQCDKVSQDQ